MLLNWPQLETTFKSDFGSSFVIHEAIPVEGGDINLAFHLDTNQGQYFVKLNTPEKVDMFRAEREGLLELAKCESLVVPEPITCGANANAAYLCLSFIEMAADIDDGLLGEAIAELHSPMGQEFGWSSNNFIGSSVQHNNWSGDWPQFFWSMRLEPQLLNMLEAGSSFPESALEPLKAASIAILEGRSYVPSLVHGDLWKGNVGMTRDGKSCIYDPAIYWGHAETDLAMARIFGGFREEFFEAYEAVRPYEAGEEERLLVYQLYHLLNHYNLFGGTYLQQCIKQIDRIMSC